METCAFHPSVETLLSCTECGTNACPDCLVHVAVGQRCVGCTQGRPVAGAKGATSFKIKNAVVGVDEHARMRRPAPLFFGLLGLFVALCVVTYLLDDWIWHPGMYMDESPHRGVAKALSMAIVVVGALIGLTLHEFAHAFVAYRGGDKTVAAKGYLTLDPRHYTDPVLSIVMPIVFLFLGGLPLPGGAVYINHRYLRSKWWDSAVSLAGPAINLLGALVLIGFCATGVLGHYHPILKGALTYLAYIEIAIVILNLLPIPGLDGYGVLEPHLPAGLRDALAPVKRFSSLLLLVLVMNGAALTFLWNWSDSITFALGVHHSVLGLGEYLADPTLF